MKTLEMNQMEQIEGGRPCGKIAYSAGLACAGAVFGGLIGAALFGPSCVGLAVGAAVC